MTNIILSPYPPPALSLSLITHDHYSEANLHTHPIRSFRTSREPERRGTVFTLSFRHTLFRWELPSETGDVATISGLWRMRKLQVPAVKVLSGGREEM